jgi:uncharacterized protein YebE (UPF0316 family)
MLRALILFAVGIVESFVLSLNTKFLQGNKKLASFIIAFIGIFIWYYVISSVIENLHNIWIIFSYAIGYASGDVLAILFDKYLVKVAKNYGLKWRRRRRLLRKKRK